MKIYRLFISICIVLFCLSLFFYYKVYEENQLIDNFIIESVDKQFATDTQNIAISLATAIYYGTKKVISGDELDWYDTLETKYLLPASLVHLTAGVSLKYQGYGVAGQQNLGPCATMSRVLLNALWRLDIPARELLLLNNAQGKGGGHVMVEFFDGGRWLVISPADTAHIWKNRRGEIATAAEIKQDPEIFKQIYEIRPNYDYLLDNYKNISFEDFPHFIPKIIKFTLGVESFDKLESPKLYHRPRMLLFYISAGLCLMFGVLAIIAKNKDSKRL
ncbi:MAG: hypothetical protein WBV23_03990 [Desulfobaccales bacterium]